MTTEHKALSALHLADMLDTLSGFLGDPRPRGNCRDAAAMLRTQHALIVQMAGALSELAELTELTRTGDYKPDSFTTQPANHAITAATQYLKGPKT